MAKPVILVTGANGQLGKELRRLAPSRPQFDFIFFSREDLPIDQFDKVADSFRIYQPQYCINCAAYTAVDKAETDKALALEINGKAAGVLASVCRDAECHFFHISTDYVFDGMASTPYKEDSPVNPQSVYGATKLEGEKNVMRANPGSIIIRTSWVYSAFGKNFVRTMLRLMSEKEELSVVNDQIGSPTYAADLAGAIAGIIVNFQLSGINWVPGIYHYSNEGTISWYDFAIAIKEISGSKCRVKPVPTSGYPTVAKRPAYSVLDKTKIVQTFGVQLKDWRSSLEECIREIRNGVV